MESKWKEVKLGDLITYQKGFAFKSKDYEDTGHPIARVSNFTDRSIDIQTCNRINFAKVDEYNNYKLNSDDVVIATVGSWPTNPASVVGKAIKVPKEGQNTLLNQNAVKLVAKDGFIQIFLFHLLKNQNYQDYIVSTAQGSANQASITLKAIFSFTFDLPPLPEQKAIAHMLGSLDDKIELNRQMNQTLEQMAQAMFKSWFVDFDPVFDNAITAGKAIPEELQAKAEKRKAIANKKPLPKEIQELFPDEFELTEEMGFIPKGWKVKIISDVADVVGGGTPSTKVAEYFCEKEIPWLSPKDLSGYEWKFISRGATDITTLGLSKSSAKLMPKGAVLFSSRAPIGYIAIAENEVSTNQGFKSLIPKDKMNSEYLFYFLKSNLEGIEAIATGSTFKEVSGTAIKTFDITIPTIEILDVFKKEINDIGKKQLIIQKQTEKLTQLRDTLLPKLISGELRVPEELIEKE